MKIKKILCAVIAVSALSCTLTARGHWDIEDVSAAKETAADNVANEAAETFVNDESNVNIARTQNSYCEELLSEIKKNLPRDSSGKIVYPDNYVGAYIDKNNTLHIMFTGSGDELKEVFNAGLGQAHKDAEKNGEIIYEQVLFSYSYLKDVQAAAFSLADDLGVRMIRLSQSENKVEIGLLDLDNKDEVISFLNDNIPDFDPESVSFFQTSGVSYIGALKNDEAVP